MQDERTSARAALIVLAPEPWPPAAPAAAAARAGRALGWLRHAFEASLGAEVHLVPGRWARAPAGGAAGLRLAPLRGDRDCYLACAELVARDRLVELLARADGDIVLATDHRRGPAGAAAPGSADAAIAACVGLARLGPRAAARLLELLAWRGDWLAQASVPELLGVLAASGLAVRAVESAGDWALPRAPGELARFVLGTKAESLARLRPRVRRSVIGDQVCCSVAQWRGAPDEILDQAAARFGARALAVRSSARGEDGWDGSRAGRFTTVLDVPPERAALRRAIEQVIASYEHAREHARAPGRSDDQILIQEMLGEVALSGVVLTRTLCHGAPYYTINYDDATARTGRVTAGAGEGLRTVVLHRDGDAALALAPDRAAPREHALADDPRLRPVLAAVRELEDLLDHDALDVELAVDAAGRVHVLQVRPLVPSRPGEQVPDGAVAAAITTAEAELSRAAAHSPRLAGQRAYLGVMPDWNPAEIVGTRPRPLALSLYRHLVTDEVWATQRAECGYRDVRPRPLLVTLAGHPYVDTRASFNSFVPAALDDELAGRLVDHYQRRLREQPHLHDKVEFEIAFTCLAFDFERRARAELLPAGFTAAEIERLRAGLLGITRAIIERCAADLAAVARLEDRHRELAARPLPPLERACALLEDCRRHGTLPFAHLARGAFVAVTLLRSLAAAGVLSPAQQAAFLGSLCTVTRDFERDRALAAAGQLSRGELIERYGHLRPGTYEITSPSYGDDPERYLGLAATPAGARRPPSGPDPAWADPTWTDPAWADPGCPDPVWPEEVRRAIDRGLARLGLPTSVARFEAFLRAAIEGREWSKFVFTRSLSRALDDLAAFAAQHGVSREQISYIGVERLLELERGADRGDVARRLAAWARQGQRAHRVTLCVQLPPLVFSRRHLRAFERFPSQPNFVTSKRIAAPPLELPEVSPAGDAPPDLRGRCVLVPQADPGYDWLFGQPLAGLVTMYGGANSHLAIRAAEADLPAAIGVGETLYEHLARAGVVELDCAGQLIRPLQNRPLP